MQEKNPILSIVVLLVIVCVAIGVLFLVFRPGETDQNQSDNSITTTITTTPTTNTKATVTPTSSTSVTTTPEATTTVAAEPPSDWVAVENTSQGYTAYRPQHFYFRLFAPDMFVLGIDPNAIPTESEYMGVISLMRLSASNNYNSYLEQLQPGYTTSTRVIAGRTWTMVEGKTVADEISDAKYVILGYFKVDEKEYLARLESSQSNYGGYKDEFETFITTLKFN